MKKETQHSIIQFLALIISTCLVAYGVQQVLLMDLSKEVAVMFCIAIPVLSVAAIALVTFIIVSLNTLILKIFKSRKR